MSLTYDSSYKAGRYFFGRKPEGILQAYADGISRARPVLDVGIGQGRNALYLAQQGLTVYGIDPSEVAVQTVERMAKKRRLPVMAVHTGFSTYSPEVPYFSAVLLFGLLQILTWEDIGRLLTKIRVWTRRGSLVFVTAFSVQDPMYASYSTDWRTIGRNSFLSDDGQVRTFFEPGEVLKLFPRCAVLHHWEGMGPYHRHGKGPRERHGRIECVFRR